MEFFGEDQILSPLDPKISPVRGKTLSRSEPLNNSTFKRHTLSLTVTLYHNGVAFDMTPHILQVRTHADINEPAGRFSILLTYKQKWDEFAYPMDYIVIKFARYDKENPFIMRGFVSNVRRTRMIDNTGKIQRAITINGENFGKIWSNYYIEYLVQTIGQRLSGSDIDPSTDMLLDFMLSENYGIARSVSTSGNILNLGFVRGLLDKMLNPYIEVLRKVNPQIPKLIPKLSVLYDYAIVNGPLVQSVNNQTVYDVMNQFGNKPWCEYFIDDFNDGPVLIYRNTPFMTEDGSLIERESDPTKFMAKYYRHPLITDDLILEEDIGFSDNEAFSYFFTYPAIAMGAETDPRAMILGMQVPSIEVESDRIHISNPHVDLENMYRFGFKSLIIGSNSIPFETSDQTSSMIALAQNMNRWLVEAFRWSHIMKNGSMRLKGDEQLRIGRYVTHLHTKEQLYIESVEHEITISQVGSMGNDSVYGYQSTIGVTRGRKLTDEQIAREMKTYATYWK